MLRKLKFLVVFISLSISLGLMSSTYSRYVADTTGNIEVLFAKWQILVNETDITSESGSTITFVPTIEENSNVAANTVAPSSKGYFDIDIDPRNIGVSFKYLISLGIENEEVPDLMITKYAIIPEDYIEGDTLNVINLSDNLIANTLYYDNNTESFKFETFTVRIFFEWVEGLNELMNDEDDTTVGKEAANSNTTFKINANISFEQVF